MRSFPARLLSGLLSVAAGLAACQTQTAPMAPPVEAIAELPAVPPLPPRPERGAAWMKHAPQAPLDPTLWSKLNQLDRTEGC